MKLNKAEIEVLEELFKARITPKLNSIQRAYLENQRLLKDPNSSPAVKRQAQENIDAINNATLTNSIQSLKADKLKPNIAPTKSEKMQALDDAASGLSSQLKSVRGKEFSSMANRQQELDAARSAADKARKEQQQAEYREVQNYEKEHGQQPHRMLNVPWRQWKNMSKEAREKAYILGSTPEKRKAFEQQKEKWDSENRMLAGSNLSRKDLSAHMKRNDPNYRVPKTAEEQVQAAQRKDLDPIDQVKAQVVNVKNKNRSLINDKLDMVHRAWHHAQGHDMVLPENSVDVNWKNYIDDPSKRVHLAPLINQPTPEEKENSYNGAHKILSAIRDNGLMPKELEDYHPNFIHLNVTPRMWTGLSQDKKDHIHALHNEILSGQHNDAEHPGIQRIINNITTPKT